MARRLKLYNTVFGLFFLNAAHPFYDGNITAEYLLKTVCFLKLLLTFAARTPFLVLWCNGSTTVFGTVCSGSNPAGTTENNKKALLM